MIYPYFFQRLSLFIWLILLSLQVNAGLTHPSEQQANAVITELYHRLDSMPMLSMSERISMISEALLEKPYLLGPLGEGSQSPFDQNPLYRTDAFDCQTYVDTVLALALANSFNTFQHCIRNVRYNNGQVSFIDRNHFTCLDWNKNNQLQGYLKDILPTFYDKNHQVIAKTATATIDKPSWYQHFTVDNIKLNPPNPPLQTKRLAELKQMGSHLPVSRSSIAYLPLSKLFDSHGNANDIIFSQIPNGAIIEIVRPNWDLHELIGTHLNVSHLGFAIRKNGVLFFREASSQYRRVIDVPLIDYLREVINSPTIRGINVQIVVPRQALTMNCTV